MQQSHGLFATAELVTSRVHHSSRVEQTVSALDAFIRRGIRAWFCNENMPAVWSCPGRWRCVFRAGYERQTSCSVPSFSDRKTELKLHDLFETTSS